jgi:hypothetical protein
LTRRFLAALSFIASLGAAQADDKASCGQFAWPLETEKKWFAAPDLRMVASGETIPALAEGAIDLQLAEIATANLCISRRKSIPESATAPVCARACALW